MKNLDSLPMFVWKPLMKIVGPRAFRDMMADKETVWRKLWRAL